MSYRRETFIKKSSEYLDLKSTDTLIINMEKGVFNTTVKYCKANGIELNWSSKAFVKKYSIICTISYT